MAMKKLGKFKKSLTNCLNDNIPEDKIKFLPSGYQKIGDIVILKLNKEIEKYKKGIGEAVLKNLNAKSVFVLKKISGELRKPNLEIIAGKGSETIHKENGCIYKIDVKKLMFSKGNLKEKGRIPKLVKDNETIVDMFSGIGYFSIPIAKFAEPKKTYAIEKNPVAVKFLEENVKLNKVKNIEIINKDCREVKLNHIADRVIMGYLPKTHKFLPCALGFLKSKGVIHYHDVFSENELWGKPIEILKTYSEKSGYKLEKILYKKIVKQYAPRRYHVVMDAKFRKFN